MKAPALEIMHVLGPILVAIAYIRACSFFREPNRRNFNAIMIAGAGAAYLNGGFGSSLGCAICDPVIAAWCFAGAPSLLRRNADRPSGNIGVDVPSRSER